MLYSGDTSIALAQHGAPLSIDDILGNGFDDGLSLHVDALDLISSVLGSRIEGDGEVQSGMQAFSEEGKAAFECFLFHLEI